MALFESIKPLFLNKPLIVAVNKVDAGPHPNPNSSPSPNPISSPNPKPSPNPNPDPSPNPNLPNQVDVRRVEDLTAAEQALLQQMTDAGATVTAPSPPPPTPTPPTPTLAFTLAPTSTPPPASSPPTVALHEQPTPTPHPRPTPDQVTFMSTFTEEGINATKATCCDLLLAQRVEHKVQGKKVEQVINRIRRAPKLVSIAIL